MGLTGTISFDYFIDMFCFDGVDNEITPPRDEMSISHNIDRTFSKLASSKGGST
jgi:hypothetical protein